jgi:tRNA A37 methylthiotransferase MiaB
VSGNKRKNALKRMARNTATREYDAMAQKLRGNKPKLTTDAVVLYDAMRKFRTKPKPKVNVNG